MWSTAGVTVSHLLGRRARVDVTLEGLTFTRPSAGTVHEVLWVDVLGAEVTHTGKGRPVLRVAVAGAPTDLPRRDDPFAVTVPRKEAPRAYELAEQITLEVDVRRRWREHAEDAGGIAT